MRRDALGRCGFLHNLLFIFRVTRLSGECRASSPSCPFSILYTRSSSSDLQQRREQKEICTAESFEKCQVGCLLLQYYFPLALAGEKPRRTASSQRERARRSGRGSDMPGSPDDGAITRQSSSSTNRDVAAIVVVVAIAASLLFAKYGE